MKFFPIVSIYQIIFWVAISKFHYLEACIQETHTSAINAFVSKFPLEEQQNTPPPKEKINFHHLKLHMNFKKLWQLESLDFDYYLLKKNVPVAT